MYPFLIIGLLLLGLMSISLVNFITRGVFKGRFVPSEMPLSVNVLRATHLISLALLTEKIVLPFGDLSNILRDSQQGWDLVLSQGIYLSLFFSVVLIVYLILLWFASMAFSLMVKGGSPVINAIEGNISNIILFAGIKIALVIFVKSAIPDLLGTLMPYSNLPVFH
jgi:hypothetical protein